MADLKISQLSAATALAGTEVVPVVQSSTTKKATIDQILSPAAGKGVDFVANTPASGMTSQLLDDYQEGTWTPAWGGTTGLPTCTYTTQSGKYTKIGNRVTLWFEIATASASGGSGTLRITGIPFSLSNASLKADYVVTFTGNMPEGCIASGTAVNLTARKSDVEISYLSVSALNGTSYIIGTIVGEV